MTMDRRSKPRTERDGVILVVVLVVVVLLSLGVLTLAQWMLAERHAAQLSAGQVQTRYLAESGVDGVRFMLLQDEQTLIETGGLYDNAEGMAAILVIDGESPQRIGRFSVVAPRWSDDGRTVAGVRYGMEDESARLHLNALIAREEKEPGVGREILMQLPGMDESIADSILDFLDEDSETREFGAELDYYSALEPPYAPKDGPLGTIEELLLVAGVTPELLYGVDANRNGMADANEADPMTYFINADNTDGSMNAGWAPYLTLHGKETNLASDGSEKINLNQEDLEDLYNELSQAIDASFATFVVGYRQNGAYEGENAGQGVAGQPDFSIEAENEIDSVLDLIGEVAVEMRFQGQQQPTVVMSPLSDATSKLATLLDLCTTSDEPVPGRVNIMQAPRTVLLCVPGMTEELADAILAERVEDPIEREDDMDSVAWLLTREVMTVDELRPIMPMICTEGCVYRIRCIGYRDSGGRTSRVDALIDTSETPATVLSSRNMDVFGGGYPLEVLAGMESDLTQ